MPPEESRQHLISIRCESCQTLYEADDSLQGREVECEKCGHHFIVRVRRHYPGEKRDPLLDQVARVKSSLPSGDFEASSKQQEVRARFIQNESSSAIRSIAGVIAVLLFIVTALILVLGASHEGVLSGVSIDNRMIIAGFVAVVASALLVYANPHIWLLMLLLGMMLSAGLVTLPVFFQGGSAVLGDGEGRQESREPQADAGVVELSEEELRDLIGTAPLEKERQRLLETPTDKTALGLWLRDLQERNCLLIREYMIREMGASHQTHFYPRERGDFLMVVTGVAPDLERLAEAASALGEVNQIHHSLHTVEVVVDHSNFKSGPIEILNDPEDPKFYIYNLVELKSIDSNRIESAVRRLSEAPPALLRDDIEKRMIQLLASNWYEKKKELCRALLVWAKDDGAAGREALAQAAMLRRNEQDVPEEMIALCIKQGESDVLPLLYEMWKKNPSRWEPWFREAGKESESVVLLDFDNTTGMLRQSACRILGQVGGKRSLPVLQVTASTAADQETRIVAEHAIRSIRNRLEGGEDSR